MGYWWGRLVGGKDDVSCLTVYLNLGSWGTMEASSLDKASLILQIMTVSVFLQFQELDRDLSVYSLNPLSLIRQVDPEKLLLLLQFA